MARHVRSNSQDLPISERAVTAARQHKIASQLLRRSDRSPGRLGNAPGTSVHPPDRSKASSLSWTESCRCSERLSSMEHCRHVTCYAEFRSAHLRKPTAAELELQTAADRHDLEFGFIESSEDFVAHWTERLPLDF